MDVESWLVRVRWVQADFRQKFNGMYKGDMDEKDKIMEVCYGEMKTLLTHVRCSDHFS